MEILISVIAVVVAAGCLLALLLADLRESRVREKKKHL